MHRNHLAEGAAGKACAGDIDEIEPAGLWLELRLRSHPAEDLLRIGQESKHRGAGRRDMRLAADDESVLHRSPPRLVRRRSAEGKRPGQFNSPNAMGQTRSVRPILRAA